MFHHEHDLQLHFDKLTLVQTTYKHLYDGVLDIRPNHTPIFSLLHNMRHREYDPQSLLLRKSTHVFLDNTLRYVCGLQFPLSHKPALFQPHNTHLCVHVVFSLKVHKLTHLHHFDNSHCEYDSTHFQYNHRLKFQKHHNIRLCVYEQTKIHRRFDVIQSLQNHKSTAFHNKQYYAHVLPSCKAAQHQTGLHRSNLTNMAQKE